MVESSTDLAASDAARGVMSAMLLKAFDDCDKGESDCVSPYKRCSAMAATSSHTLAIRDGSLGLSNTQHAEAAHAPASLLEPGMSVSFTAAGRQSVSAIQHFFVSATVQ